MRRHVEDAGGVELTTSELDALARTKKVHTVLIVLATLVAVWDGGNLENYCLTPVREGTKAPSCQESFQEITAVVMLLGAIVEAATAGQGAAVVAKNVGISLVAWLAGYAALQMLSVIALLSAVL